MHTSSPDPALLGIYLNDHLADEIADDRAALLTVMAALDVPVRRYKTAAAWAVEKAARSSRTDESCRGPR